MTEPQTTEALRAQFRDLLDQPAATLAEQAAQLSQAHLLLHDALHNG